MTVLDLLPNPAKAKALILKARDTKLTIVRRCYFEEFKLAIASLSKDDQREARGIFRRIALPK